MNKRGGLVLAGCAFGVMLLAGCATPQRTADHGSPGRGASYVAMGSSFAAGPGITQTADTPPTRCARSRDNYAHQLARKRGFRLTDVSCSGAKALHLLEKWAELPPQLDALTPDTALITVTVGGNDVGYIGGLIGASCRAVGGSSCLPVMDPGEQDWQELEARMRAMLAEMRRRAPHARIIVIDYPAVLPDGGQCQATPLPPQQADRSRAIAARLARLTAEVARQSGVELLQASRFTHGHDACAADPWMNGFNASADWTSFVPYHPNLAGMTAVANALDHMID
ncbi:SGNH/GDSL hydrolase family protein [Sphingobium sp. Sx8-8]|uniref:SGNH/GDSL hydrolase family protein n=1 Tax=Sphingobium sp. Sx8-8 TaxID=2933617 RepID=UPI001F585E24|nr:SGNH/GDSL hydrolase family protein [Sphingobium sp. Sx8-8]